MPAQPLSPGQLRKIWRRMIMVIAGVGLFIIGIYPDLIGMNFSPEVGFVQVGVWLFGLAILLIGAYAVVRVVRAGRPNSLRAEIGVRLIATAYVVAMVSSLADYIGIGSQRLRAPSFGPVQVIGLAVGIAFSLLGVVLYWPKGGEGEGRDPPP